MASVYVSRLRNAHRIGKRLRQLQRDGYILLDADGHVVSGKVQFKGFGNNPGLSIRNGNCTTVYFCSDTELDNGMHTPIKEFNALFDGWKAIHPAHHQSIVGAA